MDRRQLLKLLTACGVAGALGDLAWPQQQAPAAKSGTLVFTRLRYPQGDWNADMVDQGLGTGSEISLLKQCRQWTDLNPLVAETVVTADNVENLADCPLLYATGHAHFCLTEPQIENIRSFILSGGMFFTEDCGGSVGTWFDADAHAIARRMFPDNPLQPIPPDHPLFNCFFQVDGRNPGGAMLVSPFLEGIILQDRLVFLHTSNDLGCAWEGHQCTPGGEPQRQQAFELGINMIVYALTH